MHKTKTKPLIGVTLNWQENGDYSPYPYFVMREHYFQMVVKAGGVPVAIPFEPDVINQYIDYMDGFIFPGGDFALDPTWYVSIQEKSPYLSSPRLEFEKAIISKAMQNDKPFLGICAGMQIMAGLLGCKLTSDVMRFTGTHIDHRDAKPRHEVGHNVKIVTGTLLANIVESLEFGVNTSHREGVVTVPAEVVISATATDGVIEAIEMKDKQFAIGVQWHPEFFGNDNNPHFKLFQRLVEAAKEVKVR
ncbi:MAG: gamma-glutamyl-gamma-aminobutyrate hydrolase family protein [Alphaproteobacteria bacterium]|nr:gamma-glutamyl-gamma-aminobutyrate hydrolase family protein [Alphaproteobacteria bacterium]